MKRIKMISALLLLASLTVCAQTSGNTPVDTLYVDLQQGSWQPPTGEATEPVIINPIEDPLPGGFHSPSRPLCIGLSGHILYTYGQFDGYILYILHDDEIVYSVGVDGNVPTIPLPLTISGTLVVAFVSDTGNCFYAEVEL